MNNEAILGTWPKTGHRLVRALDDQTYLSLYGPPGGDDEGPFNVAGYSDDDAMGENIVFFVVAPGKSVSLLMVHIDMVLDIEDAIPNIDAAAGPGRVVGGLEHGFIRSVLLHFPGFDFVGSSRWSRESLIDPGPFVLEFDVSMYALLGLPPPWLLPRAELSELLEGLNE